MLFLKQKALKLVRARKGLLVLFSFFIICRTRPSIANPWERAMVNGDVEVIIVWKLDRKGAQGVSYCAFHEKVLQVIYLGMLFWYLLWSKWWASWGAVPRMGRSEFVGGAVPLGAHHWEFFVGC